MSGSQFLGSLTLRIAVLDLNDNAPTFTRNPNYLDVPESAAVGTSFRIQPATDRDAGTNAQILYSAVTPPADSPFKLGALCAPPASACARARALLSIQF